MGQCADQEGQNIENTENHQGKNIQKSRRPRGGGSERRRDHRDDWMKYPPFIKTNLYKPTNVKIPENYENENEECQKSLELEYIYGSSLKGVKGKFLHMNKNDEIVYIAAGCGVVYNTKEHTQKIFRMHNDDVKCISMHNDGKTVATGECGKDDMIYIWDCLSMEMVQKIKTYKWFTGGGVMGLTFSNCGKYLAAVGGNQLDSKLLIFEWEEGKLIAQTKCATKRTFDLRFNPKNDNQIIWSGDGEIKSFEFKGSDIKIKKFIIASCGGELQKFYCMLFDEQGRVMIGCKDGSIYVFQSNSIVFQKKVHKRAVYSMISIKDGFASTSKDGTVKYFEYSKNEFNEKKSFEIGYAVRSILPTDDDKKFYAWGRTNGTFSLYDTDENKNDIIMRGHAGLGVRTELWGIGFLPKSNYFITAGDDKRIIVFDKSTKRAKDVYFGKKKWRGVACHPTKSEFAVSSKKGKVVVFQLSKSFEIKKMKSIYCGVQEIKKLKYSPDGKTLAVGSHDCHIYLFNVQDNYELRGKLESHTSYITSLDWSEDSKHMQSCSGDYELLYWNIPSMDRVLNPSDMADTKWKTQTCLLGWTVRGVWDMEIQGDGTDINALSVNFDKKILVSADDFGDVNLFDYPTLINKPPLKKYIGHCSHVTNCVFSDDSKHLFSTGGGDLTVMQWKIVD